MTNFMAMTNLVWIIYANPIHTNQPEMNIQFEIIGVDYYAPMEDLSWFDRLTVENCGIYYKEPCDILYRTWNK